MTHPFHPLRGREFEFVETLSCWGEPRVGHPGEDGNLRFLPLAWTSAAVADPFVRVAAGRSAFRVSDLQALATLIGDLDERDSGDEVTGSEPGSVKEILP